MANKRVPSSRTAYVLERLREDLSSGLIAPGEQIRQVELAKRYGVSPTPVREALRELAADGVIDYRSHHGATVRDITPEMARHLYLMRAELEALAVRVAMETMTEHMLAQVERLSDELKKASHDGLPGSQLSTLNRRLHFAIYRHTSSLMVDQIEGLWTKFHPRITLWGDTTFSETLIQDHDAIVLALREGDPVKAADAMREHVLHAFALRQSDENLRPSGTPTQA